MNELLTIIKDKLSKKMLIALVAIWALSTTESNPKYIIVISGLAILCQWLVDMYSIRKTGQPTNGNPTPVPEGEK